MFKNYNINSIIFLMTGLFVNMIILVNAHAVSNDNNIDYVELAQPGEYVTESQPLLRAGTSDEVLNFWFDYEAHAGQALFDRALWWQKSDATDQTIRNNFADLHEQVIQGNHERWLNTPKQALAYVILLDQFSRNMYRNTAKMYTFDQQALKAAQMAVDSGYDKTLSLTERVFLYLPFEHSENLNDQERSVELFKQLAAEAPKENKSIAISFLSYAQEHHDIIEKFGRFPHRNKILSRENRPEESEFMKIHQGY